MQKWRGQNVKGIELKKVRKKQGLTQQEVARLLKIHVRHLQKLEAGELKLENLKFKTGLKLAETLKLKPDMLLEKKRSCRTRRWQRI
jgi:transcriptional regulator with XRE-family HTH domain